MAFSDSPEIDESSKNSEDSELALRSLFTRRNGFILRVESPDYGVDFNVEVALDDCPSGKMFAVQLKSKVNIQVVQKGELSFVTLNFKTSRLGYVLVLVCGVILAGAGRLDALTKLSKAV